MTEEILLVKINNTIDEGRSYYEATHGNWKVNKDRLQYIQYVVGIYKGKVVCAFIPEKWIVIENGADEGRVKFEGTEASKEILVNYKKLTRY